MREYILEKVANTPKHFKFGNIEVLEVDPLPEDINLNAVFRTIENNLPPHYFDKLLGVKIQHLDVFDEKKVNALYRDGIFYITNQQSGTKDIVDDLVHEFAHHMETLYPEEIYSDRSVIREFVRKRQEMNFELRSEGYWTDDYDFDNLKYEAAFDKFLYERVGRNMLRMITTGLFVRPYAAVSLREYFATGFEAFYTGQEQTLEKVSPILFDKINDLHHRR